MAWKSLARLQSAPTAKNVPGICAIQKKISCTRKSRVFRGIEIR